MSAAVIRLSDLSDLGLPALVALAKAVASDVDRGANKRSVLERVMRAIADKAVAL